jgi:hypothetical protein
VKLLAVTPWIGACNGGVRAGDGVQRFKGVGIVLVVDAVPGVEMEGVVFYDDRGALIYASAVVARRNREIMSLGGAMVPLTVKVVWRTNPKPVWGKSGSIEYEGPVVGDYTIPVADRIPEEVLSDIRAHGGALRLKFRLKPDGVLLGWDIERSLPIPGCDRTKNLTCNATHFFSPGGDFLETRY